MCPEEVLNDPSIRAGLLAICANPEFTGHLVYVQWDGRICSCTCGQLSAFAAGIAGSLLPLGRSRIVVMKVKHAFDGFMFKVSGMLPSGQAYRVVPAGKDCAGAVGMLDYDLHEILLQEGFPPEAEIATQVVGSHNQVRVQYRGTVGAGDIVRFLDSTPSTVECGEPAAARPFGLAIEGVDGTQPKVLIELKGI
jgi:hypothetical protein